MENENIIEKSIRWKKDHPKVEHKIKSLLKVSTKDKNGNKDEK